MIVELTETVFAVAAVLFDSDSLLDAAYATLLVGTLNQSTAQHNKNKSVPINANVHLCLTFFMLFSFYDKKIYIFLPHFFLRLIETLALSISHSAGSSTPSGAKFEPFSTCPNALQVKNCMLLNFDFRLFKKFSSS